MPKKWKIYDIIHVLLVKHNITRKRWVNEIITQLKFEAYDNDKEYKIEKIWDSTIYTKESGNYLSRLYYLVL